MEIWKDVKGYEGLYQVSNKGRIWSIRKQKYLQPMETGQGRLIVNLYAKNGKMKHELIHRLVALTFIPNPNNLPQVNHKDENIKNNCVENLEWCSGKYNANYGTRNQRIAEKHKKKVYCVELQQTFNSIGEAALSVGRGISALSMCLRGKSRTCAGYHWEYIEE